MDYGGSKDQFASLFLVCGNNAILSCGRVVLIPISRECLEWGKIGRRQEFVGIRLQNTSQWTTARMPVRGLCLSFAVIPDFNLVPIAWHLRTSMHCRLATLSSRGRIQFYVPWS